MYTPTIRNATPKQRYQFGPYTATILGDIESIGLIEYLYILVLYKEGQENPIFFVSSEVNMFNESTGGGSHFLCTFDEKGHTNYGPSDGWADFDKFTVRALQMVAERYGLDESELPEFARSQN